MRLSEFIKEVKTIPSTPKVDDLVNQLESFMETVGNIDIDLDDMCKALDIKIEKL